jgi:hypothetical protein
VKTSTIIAWLVFLTELAIFALVREVRDVAWSWLFGDVLFRGRRITFVDASEDVVQARVSLRASHNDEHVLYLHYRTAKGQFHGVAVPVNARGITWVYGWNGRDVDALRAQAALVRSAS